MIKTFLVTVIGVAFVSVGTASADCYNYDKVDEFNGSQVSGIISHSPSSNPYTPILYFTNSADKGLQLHTKNGDQQICKEVRIEVLIDGKKRDSILYLFTYKVRDSH